MIDPEMLARVAELSRLNLDSEETASLAADLARMLEQFQTIQDVDTDAVDSLAQGTGPHGTPAADEPESFPAACETLTGLSEHARDGYFAVPATPLAQRPPALP
jgi:aspartyl/glutamyl-tRNA(Asn/Gln) amidotransferase C subunit